jgi:hypothetical protein
MNLSKTNYIIFSTLNPSSSFNVNFNLQPISRVAETKILGVLIDQNLTFKSHIMNVQKKLSSTLFIFSKIRFKIPLSVAWNLYHSTFKSHLNYCLSVWGNSCPSYLSPLNILHNKILKTLLCLPFRTPTTFIFQQASILTLNNLYLLSVALFLYKFTHLPSIIPPTLHPIFTPVAQVHSYQTRASSSSSLFPQHCSIKSRQNHIALQGPLIWNSIPQEIKSSLSIKTFKYKLSNHLKSISN